MEDISEAGAGDIFALFGVDCASGESFCAMNSNFTMTPMHVPEPVMSLTVKPKKNDQLDNFLKALTRFQREDPTFVVKHNHESEEIIISGMGLFKFECQSHEWLFTVSYHLYLFPIFLFIESEV